MINSGDGNKDNPVDLSVIIVTWNCVGLLKNCLKTLREYAGDIEYEVIVVDNASSDETVKYLQSIEHPVRLIANQENIGFARANNQGMRLASAQFICLLNPDTLLVEANTMQRILQRMIDHEEISAAGCRLTFADGRHQVGDAGGMPTLSSVAAHSLLLNRLMPARFQGLFLQHGNLSPPYEKVAWVCGACTILRREVFEQTGGFNDSYFLYGEDIEWGSRMTSCGLIVAYFPDISIVHLQGGTQEDDTKISTRWIDGVAKLFYEHNHGRNWFLFRIVWSTGFALRAILYFLVPENSRSKEMAFYARYVWQIQRPISKKSIVTTSN